METRQRASVSSMTNHYMEGETRETRITMDEQHAEKKEQVQDHSIKLEDKIQMEERIIRETFLEVFGDSKFHGVANIIKNKSTAMKLIWLLLFLSGSGACTYYIYETLDTYFSYGTVTSVTKYLETIQTFPAVTICNINPFDTSNSNMTSFIDKIMTLNGLNETIVPGTGQYSIAIVREYMNLIKSSAIANLQGNSSFIRSLGYELSTLLISCYFNGYACNSSDFYWYFSYDYGNCFIFNHDYDNGTSLKTVSQSGPSSGLQLELFSGIPGRGSSYMEQSGFYISVNNNSQLPLTKFEGVKLATGYATNVGLTKTYYYRLDSPYSDCRKDVSSYTSSDSTYYKETLNITKYSQKLCFQICLQYEYIIPVCGCADASIPSTDSSQSVCYLLADINCVTNVTNEFNSVDLSVSCGKYCPLECDSEDFTYWMSSSNYPTQSYYNIISQQSNLASKFTLPGGSGGGPTQNTFSEACALVNIFLSELYYSEVDESPALTIDGVLGIIGGQLGLYLGASILTFFELLEFFGNTIWKLVIVRQSKRIVHDSNQKL